MQNSFFKSTIFLAIVACLLWSTAFVGIKVGLQYTTPLQFAGTRFFLSGIIIMPFVSQLRKKLKIARQNYKMILVVGLLQTTLVYALFYIGLNKVSGALGAMLIGSGPLFAAMVAHFSMPNDKLKKGKVLTILLGLAGIAIISINKGSNSTEYPLIWIGIFALLANNIIGGIGNVIIAKYGKELPPVMLSSLSLTLGGAVLFLISIPLEGFVWKSYPTEYYLSLAWLSFLSACAITIWFSLLKRPDVKVSNLNTWKFIIPVMGAILSWIILPNENPDIISILGMTLIAIALILLNSRWVKQ